MNSPGRHGCRRARTGDFVMVCNQVLQRVKQQDEGEEQGSGARKLIRRQVVPAYLRDRFGLVYTAGAFAKFAVNGTGPAFRLVGRDAYYTPEALDAWARSKLSAPMRSTLD